MTLNSLVKVSLWFIDCIESSSNLSSNGLEVNDLGGCNELKFFIYTVAALEAGAKGAFRHSRQVCDTHFNKLSILRAV